MTDTTNPQQPEPWWAADGRLKPHALPAATTPDGPSLTGGFDDSVEIPDLPAVSVPASAPTDGSVREQLLDSLDFAYCRGLGYGTPEELLAAYDATRLPAPTNQTELRDRIRRAICEAEGFAWDTDMLEPDEYGEVADAVLAVLPAPAHRAAALREAADEAERVAESLRAHHEFERSTGALDVMTELRRLVDAVPVSGPGDATDETQQRECTASISGDCLREAESETACDTEAGECVHGGRPAREAQQPETQAFTVQVWPLTRILSEVQCGSQDWTWDEEWADLDHYRAKELADMETQIKVNGITEPVLIGSDGRLWNGHHRLRLAVRLGIGYVPVRVPAVVSQPDEEA